MQRSTSTIAIALEKSYPPLRIVDEPVRLKWKKLAIITTEEVRFIRFEDIVYCKSVSNYKTIYVQGGKSYFCSKTLKDIEDKLPKESFLRIHHSYLVNLHCITSLRKKTGEMEIDNKLLLPISRTQKKVLYEMLGL